MTSVCPPLNHEVLHYSFHIEKKILLQTVLLSLGQNIILNFSKPKLIKIVLKDMELKHVDYPMFH